ncbi:hypothetical protein M436DRAFT_57941, partial [Aureobasidium namibiae CBS 147.97]
LNLSADEKRYYGQLFQQADTDRLGVVTGEIAVRFFEKTKVAPNVLGEIWQIADHENRGLLTKPGFSVALRLIGHYQAGRDPTAELAFRPGPLPKFDGMPPPPPAPIASAPSTPAAPIQAQGTGIRIPPLNPEKLTQYANLYDQSAGGGYLSGEQAKAIFERAGLPNETLGRIWQLADREGKGSLDKTEFCIAMHLITCYKSRALAGFPNVLPPALFEAAARRPNPPAARSPVAPTGPSAIPRQFTGPQARAQSPLARAAFGAPPAVAPQITGPTWLIAPQEKAKYDQFFSSIDTANNGHLSGEQAVKFFSDSGLPEDTLASIWDLADINSEGQLNRDEFAVAMYLIRQQRSGAPLPAFLPPALVPPGMRNQQHPTPQTTAPAFDNANNSSQLPKSATEDLFGLDEPMPSIANQQPALAPVSAQNTGSVFGADPFAGSKPSSPPPTSPTRNFTPQQTGGGPASLFKPFIPTSAFGATLAAQNTGGSNAPSSAPSNNSRSVQPPSAMDDLLGAANEDETKNITEDTTELANMSNQLGNLRNQMQEVQTKKTTNERDLAASSAQKRELEQRLAHFRAQYEQEVRSVKSLEEQLANSRTETKKLQQEFAMIEGTYQDLQNQHQQVAQALSADQQENASLKQRISQMNTEIAQLKPTLDKMRSDARQQKGMVAINKKQLATNEGEHEKIQTEMGDLKKAAEEHEQQMREQAAQEERSRQAAQEERPRAVVSPPTTVVSPAPSNTNPFFRKSTVPREEGTLSPGGGFLSSAPSPSAFDALFGPSAAQQQAGPHTPPVTSFRSEPSGNSVSSDGRMTPASPTLSATTHDEPPPPPPESRQFTPNILPMRQPLTRDQSVASSNRAAPPASRLGEQDVASVNSPWDAAPTSSYSANPWGGESQLEEEIPGAFPETPMEVQSTGQSAQAPAHDFDSAFAGFGEGHQQNGTHTATHDPFAPAPVSREVEHAPPSYGNSEFPPIQTLEHEDSSSDDDSDSERGFGDDFVAPVDVAARRPSAVGTQSAVNLSELPPITAQTSPPSYEAAQEGQHRSGSNNFPPEYTGLLPAREDPIQSPVPHSIPHEQQPQTPLTSTAGSDHFHDAHSRPMSNITDAGATSFANVEEVTHHVTPSAPQETTKDAFDDDFDDFDDLAEAKEAGGEGFDFDFPRHQNTDEFDANFDSPAQSTMHTVSSAQETPVSRAAPGGFSDFESNTGSAHQPIPIAIPFGSTHEPQAQQPHDWDAIFSGLDTPAPQVEPTPNFGSNSRSNDGAATPKASSSAQLNTMPQLGRAISTGTEHDDPILKRLTGMGYQREKALDALEKYDYDIDRVSCMHVLQEGNKF